jgi:sugar phosphate permease
MSTHPRQRLVRRLPFFYGWAIVGAAGTTMAMRNAAATLTISIFVLPMSEDLGWSRTLIVGASSLAGLAAMFASPVSGWVLHRFGGKALLGGSMLLLGGAIASIRWVEAVGLFYLLFGLGRVIFSSPVQIGAATVVAQWFVRGRGRATSVLGVMHSVGMGLLPLFAGLVISATGDWRMAWFWLGILVWIIAVPPVFALIVSRPEDVGLRPDNEAPQAAPGRASAASASSAADAEEQWSLKEAMRTPAMWMLALAGGLTFFIHTGVNIHQGAFLRDQGISTAGSAVAIAIIATGTAVGSLLWGNLMDRLPARTVYAAVSVWLGAVSLLFLLVHSAPVAYVVGALFGTGLGGLLVVPPVMIASFFGRRSLGAIRGFTEPFVSGGQAVGGIGAGLVFDATGSYTATFPVFTGAAVAGAVLILAARRPAKQAAGVVQAAPAG